MSGDLEKALLTLLEENVRSAEKMRIALKNATPAPPVSELKAQAPSNASINFCALTGYTDKAVRRKIAEGIWIEGRHYRRAPDGRITMDLEAYYRWVEGQG